MAKKRNYICVFDFETDSANPYECNPVQIAACMIEPMQLNIVEGSEFCSFMRPPCIDEDNYVESHIDTIRFHARNYKCSPEEVVQKWKDAPNEESVWKDFVNYLKLYNKKQGSSARFSSPIRAGANIRRFDNIIVDRLCKRYGNTVKSGEQNIFFPRDVVDIMDLSYYWFENMEEPKSYSMDSLRTFFGLSHDMAHDAIQDVRDEANIIQRFMRLHRVIAPKVKFNGAMGK